MTVDAARQARTVEHVLLRESDVAARAWRAGEPLRAATGRVRDALTNAAAHGRDLLADRAQALLVTLDARADAALRYLVLRVVDALVRNVDLTDLVREHVDIDALAGQLDVAAVIRRIDLDAVVARVDLDAAVARVDLDAVVHRIDLDAVVARLDLDAVVARIDLDGLAARVDPNRVVARVDLDAAVSRIDLVALAREVIDGVDLPEIVRSSTGTMASDAVRSVRSETMRADDAVAGLVDRLLRRTPRGVPVLP